MKGWDGLCQGGLVKWFCWAGTRARRSYRMGNQEGWKESKAPQWECKSPHTTPPSTATTCSTKDDATQNQGCSGAIFSYRDVVIMKS